MKNAKIILGLALVGTAFVLVRRDAQGAYLPVTAQDFSNGIAGEWFDVPVTETEVTLGDEPLWQDDDLGLSYASEPTAVSTWQVPAADYDRYIVYAEYIAATEERYGLPPMSLARQLWQESHFKPQAYNAISGAMGIAQFLKATADEWGVQPYDPISAIDGAGKYMQWLYRRTGNYRLALAAYNWGIGNLERKGIAAAPLETRNYLKIADDVGIPQGYGQG